MQVPSFRRMSPQGPTRLPPHPWPTVHQQRAWRSEDLCPPPFAVGNGKGEHEKRDHALDCTPVSLLRQTGLCFDRRTRGSNFVWCSVLSCLPTGIALPCGQHIYVDHAYTHIDIVCTYYYLLLSPGPKLLGILIQYRPHPPHYVKKHLIISCPIELLPSMTRPSVRRSTCAAQRLR